MSVTGTMKGIQTATSLQKLKTVINEEATQEQLEIMRQRCEECEYRALVEFDFSLWPLIFEPAAVESFEQAIKPLPNIMNKALKCYFKSDSQAFSDYLQLPSMAYELMLNNQFDPTELIARHDVMVSDGVAKILEMNVGTNLGGWEFDVLHQYQKQFFASIEVTKETRFEFREVVKVFFIEIKRRVLKKGLSLSNINVLVDIGGCEDGEDKSLLKNLLYKGFADVFGQGNGTLFITESTTQLRTDADDKVWLDETPIDVVMFPGYKPDNQLGMTLLRSYIKGNVIMSDTVMHTMWGNKLMLALVHEPDVKSQLSDEEVAFIERHIPWSVKLDKKQVVYQGQEYVLRDLLIENQHQFIVKQSDTAQGEAVFIGVDLSASQWQEIVTKIIGDGSWIAQQYCPPDPIVTADNNDNFHEYLPVWGVFDMNNSYQGMIVRVILKDGTSKVINGARGALVLSVFEELKKKKLTI